MTASTAIWIPGLIFVLISILVTSNRRRSSTISSTSTISPISATTFSIYSASHAVGGRPHRRTHASLCVGRISWDHF
ncbi:hypothetical protein JHK85_001777 [Glycine max]|nr:hypothetical protein JHK87_001715 [Glycine soja]KAG5069400.1 hypothetical protein JHK85_001777 [Glycine max]